jgi:CheY-like chemotaxis protein
MKETILLVEDEQEDVFFLRDAFNEIGILNPLHWARDVKTAMDYLSGYGEYADCGRFPLPGLMLLDLKQPGGWEILAWLTEQPELKSLIVMIVTPSQFQSDIDLAYQLGANAYLVKPSSPRELRELVTAIKQFWLDLNLRSPAHRKPDARMVTTY